MTIVTFSPSKAECEAAQGLAGLKEYCISAPISIPKSSSDCSGSCVSGMATPTSIDNIEVSNPNHSNRTDANVEENRLLFSKFKISGSNNYQYLQPIDQVLAETPANFASTTLAPIHPSKQSKNTTPIQCQSSKSNSVLTMEPSVTIFPHVQQRDWLYEEQQKILMKHPQQKRVEYGLNQHQHHRQYQQQIQPHYCIQQQQSQRQTQFQHQHNQCVQFISNQRHTQPLASSNHPTCRSMSVIDYPTNHRQVIHNRRRQTLSTFDSMISAQQRVAMCQQQRSNSVQPMQLQSNSHQQAMVQDREASRQQRCLMEEKEVSTCVSGSSSIKRDDDDMPTLPLSAEISEPLEREGKTEESDNMDEDEDDEDYPSSTNKRKLAKGAKEKPRWTVDMRKHLFNVIVEQKKLADMTTFDWITIGRQVGRSGKACKDQWRRALLPKLQHSFESYNQNSQYGSTDE